MVKVARGAEAENWGEKASSNRAQTPEKKKGGYRKVYGEVRFALAQEKSVGRKGAQLKKACEEGHKGG